MTPTVEFVDPNYELIDMIAAKMRQADVDEIWASHHHTPREALLRGWRARGFSTIVMVDREPCAMLGLVVCDILSGHGVPWLLGTDAALKHRRHFITLVPTVIGEMLSICSTLSNYVHVDNRASCRWLRRIGFTLDSPMPYGHDNKLFHRFHLREVI